MDVIDIIGFIDWLYSYKLLYDIFVNYMQSTLTDFTYFDREINRFVISLFMIGHILIGIHFFTTVVYFSIIELYLFILLYSILRYIKKGERKFSIILLTIDTVIFIVSFIIIVSVH